jgi:hypothetical protein
MAAAHPYLTAPVRFVLAEAAFVGRLVDRATRILPTTRRYGPQTEGGGAVGNRVSGLGGGPVRYADV